METRPLSAELISILQPILLAESPGLDRASSAGQLESCLELEVVAGTVRPGCTPSQRCLLASYSSWIQGEARALGTTSCSHIQ